MEPKIISSVQKGLIITLLLIVFGLIIYFTGQIANKPLGYVQYVILCGGIIWGCIQYAKQMNENVTFGNVFAHGFKITATVAALLAVWTFISLKFLFPEMINQFIDIARKEMESKNNMTDEQVSQALDITRNYFVPIVIGGMLFFFAIAGVISSLIGAAVAKKNPQNPFTQQQM